MSLPPMEHETPGGTQHCSDVTDGSALSRSTRTPNRPLDVPEALMGAGRSVDFESPNSRCATYPITPRTAAPIQTSFGMDAIAPITKRRMTPQPPPDDLLATPPPRRGNYALVLASIHMRFWSVQSVFDHP